MSQFSEMRSALTERLHPHASAADRKADDAALFPSRLRHVPAPEPKAEAQDRGKRFAIQHREYDPIVDTQLHHMQPRETTILHSSLQTTRFHHGFMRNHDAQRSFVARTEQERLAQRERAARGVEHNREVYASRRPELQGSLECVNFQAEPKPVVPLTARSEARMRRLAQEAKCPFDPPPPPSTLRAVSERRRDLVAREGMCHKKLNVGLILQAGDGYALPAGTTLPPIGTPRSGRRSGRDDNYRSEKLW